MRIKRATPFSRFSLPLSLYHLSPWFWTPPLPSSLFSPLHSFLLTLFSVFFILPFSLSFHLTLFHSLFFAVAVPGNRLVNKSIIYVVIVFVVVLVLVFLLLFLLLPVQVIITLHCASQPLACTTATFTAPTVIVFPCLLVLVNLARTSSLRQTRVVTGSSPHQRRRHQFFP